MGDCDDPNPKQLESGHTRPYKIRREFDWFKIGAEYLRENGLGLFHLGVLGRCYSTRGTQR